VPRRQDRGSACQPPAGDQTPAGWSAPPPPIARVGEGVCGVCVGPRGDGRTLGRAAAWWTGRGGSESRGSRPSSNPKGRAGFLFTPLPPSTAAPCPATMALVVLKAPTRQVAARATKVGERAGGRISGLGCRIGCRRSRRPGSTGRLPSARH
jgi:hypothetical protein